MIDESVGEMIIEEVHIDNGTLRWDVRTRWRRVWSCAIAIGDLATIVKALAPVRRSRQFNNIVAYRRAVLPISGYEMANKQTALECPNYQVPCAAC